MSNVNPIVGNDGANLLAGGAGRDVIYGYDPAGPQASPDSISAARVASGLSQPVFATAPAGDASRLFIVEKAGVVKILELDTQQVLATPFLDLSSEVNDDGEQGLLGLAFHPDFEANGLLYVSLINQAGDTEIRRYQVSAADPNLADPASAQLVLSIDQPAGLANHKAGWIGFGPDGYLYAALGDGGGSGDPDGNAQDLQSLLGKMLRLDVNADAFPEDPARNYAIPADNPFIAEGADEIWALGLRNPWRDSFDRALGTLYIADVGQNVWEEIDLGHAGANYGWDLREGPDTFNGGSAPGPQPFTEPIHWYQQPGSQSVTGGYVYRGPGEALQGHYFFADFVSGRVFTLSLAGEGWVAVERTAQIATSAGAINNPASFGEDALGNLYLVDLDGDIFRLTPQVASADLGDTLSGLDGEDMLYGGAGADSLLGGAGADSLLGGNGADTLRAAGGDDILLGGAGDDSLLGGGGADLLQAAGGNDTLLGAADDDLLRGGGGADLIQGAGGNDTVIGGAGDDLLRGGAGADVFGYEAAAPGAADVAAGDHDTIEAGPGDVIDITDALAGVLIINGNPLADGDALPDALLAGSTNIAFDSTTQLLQVDSDNDGNAGFSISLAGVSSLTYDADESRFLLAF